MDILLVRHAQPDWEPDERATDTPDLTDLGHEQARLTADALAHEQFDALYASPLPRALQTAAPIAEKLGLEPHVESWLREIELPPLEGKSPDEVQTFFRQARARELEHWWEGYVGGESFRHFYERVSSGVESLLAGRHALGIHEADGGHRIWQVPDTPRARRLLVVAHEGTNSVILSHLLGIEPSPFTYVRFSAAWCSISRIHTAPAANGCIWSLQLFGDANHLASLDADRDGRTPSA